jgi:hypothetical protein
MHRSHFFKAGLIAGLFSLLFSATGLAAPVLKLNSSGRDVMLLQQKLQNVGYTIKDIDGIYGEETKRVVIQFQRDNNLRATGVVNNATWRALKDTKSIYHGSIKDKEALLERIKKTAPNYGPTVPNNKPILERSKVSSIISTAKSYIGVPYSFGGATPKAFDCSGYLQYALARTASASRASPTTSTVSACARRAKASSSPATSSSSRRTNPAPRTAAFTSATTSSFTPRQARASASTACQTAIGSQGTSVASTSLNKKSGDITVSPDFFMPSYREMPDGAVHRARLPDERTGPIDFCNAQPSHDHASLRGLRPRDRLSRCRARG